MNINFKNLDIRLARHIGFKHNLIGSVPINIDSFLDFLIRSDSKELLKIIKFEDLNSETNKSIRNIFDYFELAVDDNILNKSIELNLKSNFLSRIYNENSNRFSKRVFDKKLEIFIRDLLDKQLSNIFERYKKL